jgi:hypothetical protein
LKLLAWFAVSLFRSKGRLEGEIVILRHQLNVLRRGMPSRARLTLIDRLIFVWLCRLRPSMLNAVVIVQPETVVRWQREGFGSIRRECLDHVVVFGEAHLCRILKAYVSYYNAVRTHLSLNKDVPIHRPIHRIGRIIPVPVIGGLHHQYCRT